MPFFAVTRRRGPAWDRSRRLDEQADWDAHAEFMDALAADGFVRLGGPLGDGELTLLAVAAGSEDEIRQRLEADPWVASGLLELAGAEPWEVRLGRERLEPGAAAPGAASAYHLLTEERGPAWQAGRAREEQDGWDDHARFMDALDEERFVVFGGPVGDGVLVWLVIDVPGEDAIKARLADDPWIRAEILQVAGVEPWQIRLCST